MSQVFKRELNWFMSYFVFVNCTQFAKACQFIEYEGHSNNVKHLMIETILRGRGQIS